MSVMKKIKYRIMREFFRTHSYPRKNIVDNVLTENPFDYSGAWQETFTRAMNYNFNYHREHSVFYNKLCHRKGFDDYHIQTFDDIWDIPYILTDIFKHHLVDTRTARLFRTEMTSSGTSGRKSKIMIDMISGQRLLYSIYHIFRSLGLVNQAGSNYIMLAYNPEVDDAVATTNSDIVMSHLTPRKDVFYALDLNGEGRMDFLKDACVEKLKEYIDEGLPVRMLGFTHHTCEIVNAYNKKYGRVRFPKDSCIINGGGLKTAANAYGPDFDFLKFLQMNTDIDLRNVRDLYTLNEHAVFYLECEEHNKHVPNVALACIRDPRDFRRLPHGEKGLVHLYTPIFESTPLASILTTDYGYTGEKCPCAIGGPYIKISGRAGLSPMATCALTADKYVKSVKNETTA